jgi:hypothetical protein
LVEVVEVGVSDTEIALGWHLSADVLLAFEVLFTDARMSEVDRMQHTLERVFEDLHLDLHVLDHRLFLYI